MADLRIVWDPDRMAGDLILKGRAFDETHELVTAIAVALFTHRTAEADDRLPHDASDRRGWWADYDAGEIWGGWPIGSRLWLLSREKQTEETRTRAEGYIREALEPFRERRIVADYTIAVDWFAPERLGAEIVLYRNGRPSVAVRFESLWAEIERGGPLPEAEPAPVGNIFPEEFPAEFV